AYQRAARRLGSHAVVSRVYAAAALSLSVLAVLLDHVVGDAAAAVIIVFTAVASHAAMHRFARG
ncbi:MAG: hypothetical protein AAF684_12300, partial [Pseudomonadota bacterium]